ncbi:WD40 repeat-like protein [Gloeophyllum trabeum ATCC 11539]|uniref:Elongator complex protein 2 n=1 Tax=Gloeophyllum trabeum (strain ATCC 11539 / FP-39264 / Madison 617) TaxID=670483 RepID=S7QJN4_GLOTA|nr:WD40 repeat-like protein [Gloeophyllum trabeum ATCC 11539]EPQ59532.1 WD40 repeat-like protein [Gloeophyllum trabeum ATCC 11539]
MTVEISTAYISASANRYSQAGSSSNSSLVAFGSSRYVALWNTAWKAAHIFRSHQKSISTLHFHGGTLATGSSDSSVKIWKDETQTIDLRGKYPLSVRLTTLPDAQGSVFILVCLPATVLAIGGTDKNVQIWTRSDESFVRSAVLSGHEDWVRSLDFHLPRSGEQPLILASGSQDSTVRLWNIEVYRAVPKGAGPADSTLSDELLDEFESSLGTLADAEEGDRQISLKRHVLTVKSRDGRTQQFSLTFDALLVGHEAGITSLSWRPDGEGDRELTLLSTSTDSSLILWSPSTIISTAQGDASSLWINRQRFGDVGGQRLGGFVGGIWSRGGADALAWGWSGGWRRWRCTSTDTNEAEVWKEIGAVTGHNGPVRGITWSPQGEYLISASLDQTTRIHGPIPESSRPVWHELARPQVHGYDLIDVASLDPLRFVSIADEKVVRVFEAPQTFVDALNGLKVAQFSQEDQGERPAAASVPPLGLSNKAVKDGEIADHFCEIVRLTHESLLASIVSTVYDWNAVHRRPFEGELSSMTLWPEIEKVFGHGYESISLAVSNNKKFIATACKATTPEHAVIRVYETDKWQPVGQPLQGHSLTVTRIAFSPDDRYILTVSRDRSWRLFEAQADSSFAPIAADKSHSRIIWDCAWAQEGDVFATASRDKTVKIWRLGDDSSRWVSIATLKTKEAATAVAFNATNDGRRLLAVGTEIGGLSIYSSGSSASSDWTPMCTVDHSLTHSDHIYRLAWRPGRQVLPKELACCSEDGTLRILVVQQ